MPALPLIGLSTSQTLELESGTPLNGVSRRYAEVVAACGGLPLLLPVLPEQAAAYAAHIDALLLTGGHDVSPALYGAHPRRGLGELDPTRDSFEAAVYREVRGLGKPVMGICRGLQVINVLEGGTLHQHLPDEPQFWADHAQLAPGPALGHEVRFVAGSRLADAHGETAVLNSYHHQAVKDVAGPLRVTGTAPDGVIEALEGDGLIAVQWHPELLFPVHPQAIASVAAFMQLIQEA